MTATEIAAITAVAMNAGAIVWGAATFQASLKHHDSILNRLESSVASILSNQNSHETRLSVLESEWDGEERRKLSRRNQGEQRT